MYDGETYKLKISYSPKYPFEAPETVFIGDTPEHEHVYSNGHICLSIL